ncbi:ATP-binding protein [Sphaerisporangium perillae]|uniref:ATP-binding protein n=1 Tax=Sphaerisporangium perillae TaxID=2935860 RepID=UPI00200E90C3|nr:ATP-binding protein [Sphaerisporangium perillae]
MSGATEASPRPSEYVYGPGAAIALLGQKWIPRDAKCVASARRFVRDVAADWNATHDAPDIAELLASEVVTNALMHGAVNLPAASTVRIAVGRDGRLMTVDVYDACIAIPELRRADSMETSGRGLAIVETLSHKWGWTLHPHGKSVWFQLAAWPEG